MSAKLQRHYNAGGTWLTCKKLPFVSAIFHHSRFSLLQLFFTYHPHRTFHQLIISLPESRACFSPLFSSLASSSFSHFFFLPLTLLRFTCTVAAAFPFNALLFRQSAGPRLLYSPGPFFPSSSFSFRFECLLPSLYASRSSKRRIIVDDRSFCFAMNNTIFRLLPPGLPVPDRLCLTADWMLLLGNFAAELFHDLVAISLNPFLSLTRSLPFRPSFFLLFLALKLLSPYIFFPNVFLPR